MATFHIELLGIDVSDTFVTDSVLCLAVRVDVVAGIDHDFIPLVVVGLLGAPKLCLIF